MTPKHLTVPALAAAVALATAGTAIAAAPASVDEQLARADAALSKAAALARQGSDAVAAAQLSRADRLTVVADRRADALTGLARAAAERKVAVQLQQNAEASANLIDDVDGAADRTVSKEVADAVARRTKALDVLAGLAVKLPKQAQVGIAKAIAALTDAGTKPAMTLDAALKAGEVDPSAVTGVEAAIAGVAEGTRRDADRLADLAQGLPVAARRGIERAQRRAEAAGAASQERSERADACDAERRADPTAFETKYRTNTGEQDGDSNAYGMCAAGFTAEHPPGRPSQTQQGNASAGSTGTPSSQPSSSQSGPSASSQSAPSSSSSPSPAGTPSGTTYTRPA